MNREQVFAELKSILVEDFEVDGSAVTGDAHLYSDLDLDSIDAVDLVVKLQDLTGKKIQPEQFKAVRTVDDVVDAVLSLVEAA
ncbi:acyl carrier protein [Gallaecimonas xiamenensis]|uniref:Acyl carrier protein n=1 Tax=Gallaecimonas xiamenensis 3-C-1 TaxID=745411 RepID=K2KHE4_9GAMM|nr:acyl carrier protein [Gallaecimonas xiamenensis]EKE76655.1 acyl carrier protein [Gallaecimonas xiamenensis 3-C-1]